MYGNYAKFLCTEKKKKKDYCLNKFVEVMSKSLVLRCSDPKVTTEVSHQLLTYIWSRCASSGVE